MAVIDLDLQGHLTISTQNSKKLHSTSLLCTDLGRPGGDTPYEDFGSSSRYLMAWKIIISSSKSCLMVWLLCLTKHRNSYLVISFCYPWVYNGVYLAVGTSRTSSRRASIRRPTWPLSRRRSCPVLSIMASQWSLRQPPWRHATKKSTVGPSTRQAWWCQWMIMMWATERCQKPQVIAVSDQWLSARLQYLQCVSNGDSAVLH